MRLAVHLPNFTLPGGPEALAGTLAARRPGRLVTEVTEVTEKVLPRLREL